MGLLTVESLVDFAIAVSVISIVAVIFRFWSRLVSPGVGCSWDDWLALAALPTALVLTGATIAGTHFGTGKPKEDVPDEDEMTFYKLQMIGTIAFDLSISFSKLSALAFYSRVFRRRTITNRVWLWCFYITLGLTIAWPISMIPLAIWRCSPIKKFFMPSIPGRCTDKSNTYLAGALSSVTIDVFILVLPLPLIFQLQIRLVRKLLIAGTFVVGYGAALMSVGRLISAAKIGTELLTDFIEVSIPVMYWVTAEACLSIVAICLPAIFQLFNRGFHFGFGSLFDSRDFSQLDSGQRTPRRRRFAPRLPWARRRGGVDCERDGFSESKGSANWTSEDVSLAKAPTSDGTASVVTTTENRHPPNGTIHIRKDINVAVG